jgi:hypothetical protein
MRYCFVTRCSVVVRRLEIHTRGWSRFAEGAASGGRGALSPTACALSCESPSRRKATDFTPALPLIPNDSMV